MSAVLAGGSRDHRIGMIAVFHRIAAKITKFHNAATRDSGLIRRAVVSAVSTSRCSCVLLAGLDLSLAFSPELRRESTCDAAPGEILPEPAGGGEPGELGSSC